MKKLAIIAFTALGIAACGSGRKNAAQDAKSAAADPALQGSWQSPECNVGGVSKANNAQSPIAAPKSHRVEYKFDGARAVRKTVAYEQINCQGAELERAEEIGDFYPETDKSKFTNDNEKPIKIVWNKLEITTVGKAGVDFANGDQLCGHADWQDGKSKEVTQKSSEATCYGQKLPRTEYNMYKVSGDTLQLGANITTDSQEKDRPAKATGPVYKKH